MTLANTLEAVHTNAEALQQVALETRLQEEVTQQEEDAGTLDKVAAEIEKSHEKETEAQLKAQKDALDMAKAEIDVAQGSVDDQDVSELQKVQRALTQANQPVRTVNQQKTGVTLPAMKLLTPPDGGWEVPENFSIVVGQIYRSSFPRPENFEYLKRLKLKSILVLIPEIYPDENLQFMKENNIQFFQVGMSGNKEPFVHVPHDVITRALEIAINPANHPLLIHCNRGKHRTGCLSGCIRRLQDWSLTMIFDEYRRFAYPKARPLDQQFIELYDSTEVVKRAWEYGWLPLQW
ncbi:Tyrosine-protein phosphatase SIW14 [Yarrowia sp. C11]|nr:Tyrosine-protein phosphatase SIW14 [Yarrowia sp. E02]KAG5369347.1 Tyrosine-protein phosphatase SIW14 [Yarrowia sp. C11]